MTSETPDPLNSTLNPILNPWPRLTLFAVLGQLEVWSATSYLLDTVIELTTTTTVY